MKNTLVKLSLLALLGSIPAIAESACPHTDPTQKSYACFYGSKACCMPQPPCPYTDPTQKTYACFLGGWEACCSKPNQKN